eukprot:30731-Chlamydomonas_euryale.AAC.2
MPGGRGPCLALAVESDRLRSGSRGCGWARKAAVGQAVRVPRCSNLEPTPRPRSVVVILNS